MKSVIWSINSLAAFAVILAPPASAEEKANVQTALSGTMISGYVDTSAQWNFGTGNGRLPAYRFNGPSKADGFNLDVVQVRLEKPLEAETWAAGYKADLWFGPDANTLGTQSLGTAGDFAIRQAYVALRAPLGNGFDFKVGVFDSIIGYEGLESGNNPNYTRSYGHSIEPMTHTGVVTTYRVTQHLRVTAGVADTVGQAINSRANPPKAESYKAYMGAIEVTAPDGMGFLAGSTLYAGVVNGFSPRTIVTDPTDPTTDRQENQTSWYVGGTLATPVTGLRLGAAFDYLEVQQVSGETWTVAGYASLQVSERLSLHARAEYLRDRGEQKVFTATGTDSGGDPILFATNPDKVLALTATAQYDLWKNVVSRLELRWDHSLTGQGVWGEPNADTGIGSLKNAWMLAANVIYKF